ncbi:MFS transporter [Dictyobacter alpinus]|uniref:MFS transporter n=1 Tax=Dictyobacter alpinus TaxID=2014873 RepID=A0A402BGQ3_9CHLR|nr:MFS transporter [Dictyobacter alpinus]GCE30509.1 MFS transporter [Dictyobacter alpinus]
MKLFRAFSNRSFVLLWTGQIISRLGDSLHTIALAWWVLEKTGSAAAMGTVLICSTIPMLICLLIGGVAVDRLPRVSLMLTSDLIRGGIVLLIAFLSFQQRLELWQIFVMSALFGTIQAFFYPAYTALVPDLVPVEMLSSANSLRSISVKAAGLIGPAIAATIIAIGGTSLAFAVDALTFLISAICIIMLPRVPVLTQPMEKENGVVQDIGKGISTVLNSPWLWVTLVVASVSTIFLDGPAEAALPLLIKQRFGVQVGLYALLNSLSALGSIIAALGLGHLKRLHKRGLLTYGAWMLASLMLLVMGLPLPVAAISLAFFIQGASITTLGLAWINSLQEFVPANLLGRVASIDMLVSSGLVPIGYGLAGIAADRIGAAPIFIIGGSVATTVIALGLLHPTVRAVD